MLILTINNINQEYDRNRYKTVREFQVRNFIGRRSVLWNTGVMFAFGANV